MTADAAAWDAEYRRGRYAGEPPLPFVDDIVRAAADHGLTHAAALDIGAGNGRNYRGLLAAGLDVTALDISAVAIDQLAEQYPHRPADRFVHGDLAALPAGRQWPVVAAIQVFQHGDRAGAHRHVRAAQGRLAAGGLIAVRVNEAGTDIWFPHDTVEAGTASSGPTVRYLAGPKAGMDTHFFTAAELAGMFADRFVPVLAPRLTSHARTAPKTGRWSQIEAIWRKLP